MTDFAEISEQLDLEFWAEREGRSFKATRGRSGMQLNFKECPECGDRRWRVYLNADSGAGNCFVCSETYSKLKFINRATGLSWAETKRHCLEVLKEQGWRPKRETTVAVEYEEVKFPDSYPIPTPTGDNLLYLEDRGIDAKMAGYFHLRMCEKGWWNFTREDGTRGGQAFDMRVIIPVFDLDGTFVTYQGRDITGTSDTRYLFPKGLPGTGRYLLNGQNALRSKRVVVGEGAFDVMATKKALDEDLNLRDVTPIGTFGKHLSYGDMGGNDQLGRFLKLKHQGLEEVTMMWDGTQDATIAALDAAKLLTRIGLKVRIALLPADHDPNEVLPEVVRAAFYSAKLYSTKLDATWRLRSPFAVRKKPVKTDFTTSAKLL